MKEIQERIAGCYVAILNYAIQHNYSYKRWKQILKFMIYKEQGNVKIHQLRVIHIYEADYNFHIGAVWKMAYTTRTEIRRNQSRAIWKMPRPRLHISHIPGRIEKRYFDTDENGIFKL